MKRKILQECLNDAFQCQHKHPDPKGYLHFSYVIQNNSIIGKGFNRLSSETHPSYPAYSKLHSEPDAYAQCRGLLEKNTPWQMVNIRLTRTGLIKLSKPCKCCYTFLRRLDCKEVWFSTENGFAKLEFE